MVDQGVAFHCFGSKAGLFLALLDQQFATRIEQAQQAYYQPPSKTMPFDREFALLFLEFVCAAGRDAKGLFKNKSAGCGVAGSNLGMELERQTTKLFMNKP